MEFVLHHQASNSTSKLDEHLEEIKQNQKARPTAVELLESLAELAQGTQALRAALMLSLAARVVVKSDLTLEDVELHIPQILQLSLLLHVRKLVRQLDPANRAEWECHVNRWVLRTVVRGDELSQGGRQLPGAPVDEGGDEDVRNPKTAAKQLASFVLEHSSVALASGDQDGSVSSMAQGADLPLLCVTSHDLAEWHLHRGELKRAEELFRMALNITHHLVQPNTSASATEQVSQASRRCTVRPERLSALALALRMLRLSQPEAPPTPLVPKDSRKFVGDESVVVAGGGSEIPISSGAVMVLTAEMLRLAGHGVQLVQLLHLDNVLSLARWLSDGEAGMSTPGAAAGQDVSRSLMPLPWAYREHLSAWMMEGGEASGGASLSKQASAANCVVTLACAPAIPSLVALRIVQSSPLSTADGGAGDTPVGTKRDRLTRDRLSCSTLALDAVKETINMLESAADEGKRTSAVDAVFPAHLPQAAALTPMIIKALAAAADSGVLSAARGKMQRALETLQAAVYEQGSGAEIEGTAAASLQEAAKKKIKGRACRPSDLGAFLRSVGKWHGSGVTRTGAGTALRRATAPRPAPPPTPPAAATPWTRRSRRSGR